MVIYENPIPPMPRNHILTPAVLVLVSAAAQARVGINLEFDGVYGNNGRGTGYAAKAEINALKQWDAQYFVLARASYLRKRDATTDVDDLWVQAGNDRVAFKLGKLEAADLFPLVRDALIENAGETGYRTRVLRGRAKDVFHGVFNLRVGGGLGFELGLIHTQKDTLTKGLRPLLTYTSGPLSVAAGMEAIQYGKGAGQGFQARSGAGLTAGYQLGAWRLTGSAGSGQTLAGNTAHSQALTLNHDAGFTVGLIQDATQLGPGTSKSTAMYGAYTLPFFGVQGATATLAASAATAGGINTAAHANGLKLRLNYGF